jgi:RNA polymerase sigma factor (sigma-70 family)
VQDVFVSLLERPEQFEGRSSLTTFLYGTTTHACLNRIRNQKNRARLLEREAWAGDEGSAPLSPESRLTLHGLLRRMPDEWARAAVYHYMDDLTHDDIAALMGCSRRHVGNLLARVAAWAQTEHGHAD